MNNMPFKYNFEMPIKILYILFILIIIQSCNSSSVIETDKEALQTDPKEQNKKIEQLFDQASKTDSIGDYQASVKFYSDILSLDKTFTGALINRATAYINLGDTTAAFNDLNRAVIYSPHEKTYYSRGTAFVYLNTHLNIAKEDLLRAIALNPENSASYYSLSMLELSRKHVDSCAFYLQTADKIGYNANMSNHIKNELNKLSKK
jgi:tetratricopeptide (TPR) repeat protein